MPLATLGKQLAGANYDSGMFSGSFQEALLSRPLLPLLLFTPTLGEMSRGARQELGTPGCLEKEPRASQRSNYVQFPGASVGTPGRSGRQTVFVLPSTRSSVSAFCFLGIMSVPMRWTQSWSVVRDQALHLSAVSHPGNAFWLFLLYNIWKISRRRK